MIEMQSQQPGLKSELIAQRDQLKQKMQILEKNTIAI
jgi:hypothetical protein